MAPRIRSLKPDCWQDEALGTVSVQARLLFVGLITQADDDGRLRGAPALVKAQVFPYDPLTPDEVENWLNELARKGLIQRYEVHAEHFIALRGWKQNQRISHPVTSVLPNPPEVSAVPPEDSRETVSGLEGNGVEGIGMDRKGEESPLTRERFPLSFLLAELIEANGSKPPTVTKAWVEAERLMLGRDERTQLEAEVLIRWSQKDEFWRSNILSMSKFRDKYDTLRLQHSNGDQEPEYDWRKSSKIV